MNTNNWTRHLAWGVLGLVSQQAFSQATQPNNNGGPTSFLGWNAGANQVLEVKNEANQPIEFYTSNLLRMRFYPNQNNTIGGFQNVNQHGFLGLSGHANFFNGVGPFTRLHLADNAGSLILNAQEFGFRRWQRNGITFTGNADHGYIGQKYVGNDNMDFKIPCIGNLNSSYSGEDRILRLANN